MGRRLAIGAGLPLVLTSVGLYASGWPEQIRAHPALVLLVFVVGAVLIAIGFWLNKSAKSSAPLPDVIAGRDHWWNKVFAWKSTINIGNSTPSLPPPPQTSEVAKLPSLPTLNCRPMWIDAYYEGHPGRWIRADERTPLTTVLAIVVFENPRPPRAEIGTPLKGVEAHLKLHSGVGRESVNTAYWIDYVGNWVDMPSGHERSVVLGHFDGDGDTFISYENKISSHQVSRRQVIWNENQTRIVVPHNIAIEVVLMESGMHSRTVEEIIVEIDVVTRAIQARPV